MRFVFHDHITENRHFDFMIETEDDLLRTWRILPSDFDLLLEGKEITGERIQDHDKKFLSYEGSLSIGKGSIKKIDQGDLKIIQSTDKTITVFLSGQMFKGTLNLSLIIDHKYKILYFPEA